MKKLIYLKQCFSFLALFLLLGWNSQAQNLVQNGSFEWPANAAVNGFFSPTATQMTPWVSVRTHVHHRGHHNYGGHRNQHLDLNGNDSIQQTITGLDSGQWYTVRFIRRIHNGQFGGGATVATADVDVISGVTNIGHFDVNLNAANPDHTRWVADDFQFQAIAPTAVLRFMAVTSNNPTWGGVMIDDVSLFGQCAAWLTVDTVGCDEYLFSSFSSVDYDTELWYLDGVITDLNHGPVHLTEGIHEICMSYFGSDTTQDSTWCCDRLCFTLDVEGIDTTSRTDTLCGLEGVMYSFNPCTDPDFPFYSMNPGTAGIVPCSQAMMHLLSPGQYEIRRYDEDTCLRWIETLTILLKNPDSTFCYRRVVDCGFATDPNSVMPDDCPDCWSNVANINYLIGPAVFISTNANTATTRYQRIIEDRTNCRICVFTFDIVDSACNFMPDAFWQVSFSNPYNYQFTHTAPTQNLCGNITWTITDTVSGAVIFTLPQAPLGGFNFTFPQVAGVYRVTLNVCVCVCNTMCCKSISVIIVIPDDPFASVIQNPATGHSYSQEDEGGSFSGKQVEELPTQEEKLPISPIDGTGIRLIPNPTSSEFKIVIDGLDATVYDIVSIIAADGKIVETFRSIEADHLYQLRVAPGAYTVQVIVQERAFGTKLLIH